MKTSIRDIVRRERWATAYAEAMARHWRERDGDQHDDAVTVRVNVWVEIMNDVGRQNAEYIEQLFRRYLTPPQ